ncbi:hypothetical protein DFQ30_001578 [Apophysomyces sp. BC1015]|nr:hypothetical protein DFQ30_001578 [Apophysomyces sp. BC1015]
MKCHRIAAAMIERHRRAFRGNVVVRAVRRIGRAVVCVDRYVDWPMAVIVKAAEREPVTPASGSEDRPPAERRQPFERPHAGQRIAVRVQRRRPYTNAEFPGQHRNDAAADATLGRQSDMIDEVSGGIVRAACEHQCAQPLRRTHADDALAAVRHLATIGQEQNRPSQIDAVHLDRALATVRVDYGVHRHAQITEALHEMRHRAVSIRVRELRFGDARVVVDIGPPREAAHELHERRFRLNKTSAQYVGHHQRAGIDERVARHAVLVLKLHQRIERIARWFSTDALPQRIALQLKSQHLASQRDDRHAEMRRIHLRELGNIVGNPAFAEPRCDVVLNFLEDRLVIHCGGSVGDRGTAILSSRRTAVDLLPRAAAPAHQGRRRHGAQRSGTARCHPSVSTLAHRGAADQPQRSINKIETIRQKFVN